MKRILDLAERGLKLSISENCLCISGENRPKMTMSLDELEALLISEPAVSMTGVLLTDLAEKRIPVILCDRKYLPAGILCPVIRKGAEYHTMLPLQIAAGTAWKKKMWKQLIAVKIRGQAANLSSGKTSSGLRKIAEKLRSGDPKNQEAFAAKLYWRALALFPARDRYAEDANLLFNYGYAVLYAAFARAICAAGLHPHIGIHHHGEYNPFSLASDLMEPFRPVIDGCILEVCPKPENTVKLDRIMRSQLLAALQSLQINIGNNHLSLQDAVAACVASYKQCLQEQSVKELLLPEEA